MYDSRYVFHGVLRYVFMYLVASLRYCLRRVLPFRLTTRLTTSMRWVSRSIFMLPLTFIHDTFHASRYDLRYVSHCVFTLRFALRFPVTVQRVSALGLRVRARVRVPLCFHQLGGGRYCYIAHFTAQVDCNMLRRLQ